MRTDVAVIILTYNEEANIAQALQSVCGWAREVFVVDSFSTDATVVIARKFDCRVFQNAFGGYATQRNWALDNLPIQAEWVFFLDADEWLPDNLKVEIANVISSRPRENGFYIKRRMMWMGRWIRRGYYPSWSLRLFRATRGRCESREINEHIVADPPLGRLNGDFLHEDRKGLSSWMEKHVRYARREAEELLRGAVFDGYVRPRLLGSFCERRRWLRQKIYNRLPVLLRPWLYFGYCYFIRGGFLDGREAMICHFFHALWYPLLIDVNFLELKRGKVLERRVVHSDTAL